MSNNGEPTVAEKFERFMRLAGDQIRGLRSSKQSQPVAPTPEALRELHIMGLLRADSQGTNALLQLLTERISDANLSAHTNVTNHPLCAGFLGAEAALRRLYEDINRLRG